MALRDTYPLYVANVPEQPNADLVVTDKVTGNPATRVAMADAATIDRRHVRQPEDAQRHCAALGGDGHVDALSA